VRVNLNLITIYGKIFSFFFRDQVYILARMIMYLNIYFNLGRLDTYLILAVFLATDHRYHPEIEIAAGLGRIILLLWIASRSSVIS